MLLVLMMCALPSRGSLLGTAFIAIFTSLSCWNRAVPIVVSLLPRVNDITILDGGE
jgi:hypothetical protein